MVEELVSVLFLNIPFVSSLALSLILAYWFLRDRNKRKLMFAVGTFVGAWGNCLSMMHSIWGTKLLAYSEWLFVPIALAVPTAVLSSLRKVKDFEKPFKVFLSGTGLAILVLFAQLPLESLRGGLMILFMALAVPMLFYLVFRDRESSDLIFLLATLCFISQGIVREAGLAEELPILLSLFGTVFTGLMFAVPTNNGTSSLSSFLTLEKKLDKANKDLRATEEKLLKAERLAAIGELAGMVGHDMRNPLQGIAGAAYYLRARCGSKLDDKGREMVAIIENCIQRSNKIINDLLEYSKEMHLDLEKTSPKSLVKRTLLQTEIPAHIEIDNQTRDEPILRVDRAKAERVFLNLIKNSFDAMPNGGKLTIASEKIGDTVAFSFQDTGEGMTDEVMSRIWTPLFTTKSQGMGFGLAICKRIVEAHGGEIRAESKPGEGSVFTVIFPLEPKPRLEGQSIFLSTSEIMQETNALTTN